MLKKLYDFLRPPPEWRLPVLILLGAFFGLAVFIYYISNASSYMSDDPKTCINCHVMIPQYATWQKSSHARVATCVDCHVPHDTLIRKYEFKMKDGLRHSRIYTLRQEPQVIQIKEAGKMVVQENCIRCHSNVLEETGLHQTTYEGFTLGENKLCWDCHREVPHGTVHSLSATPDTYYPEVLTETPGWLKNFVPILEKYYENKKTKEKL